MNARRQALEAAERRVARERLEFKQALGRWVGQKREEAVSLRGLGLAVLAGFVVERLLARRWRALPAAPPARSGRLTKLLGLAWSLWQMRNASPLARLPALREYFAGVRSRTQGGGGRK